MPASRNDRFECAPTPVFLGFRFPSLYLSVLDYLGFCCEGRRNPYSISVAISVATLPPPKLSRRSPSSSISTPARSSAAFRLAIASICSLQDFGLSGFECPQCKNVVRSKSGMGLGPPLHPPW